MTEVPGARPVTTPDKTVAILPDPLLQVPPLIVLVNVVVSPTHRAVPPVTGADGLTVMLFDAVQPAPRE